MGSMAHRVTLLDRLDRLDRAAVLHGIAAFAVLIGIAVLIGWAFEIEGIQHVLPGVATMKTNTAACFVLVGIEFWLLAPKQVGGGRLWAGRAVGALAFAIVGLTLVEWMWGADFDIDQVVFVDRAIGAAAPGRMSLATTITFALLIPAVTLLQPPPRVSPVWSVALAIAVLVLSAIGLAGYLYSHTGLLVAGWYATMAVHTAATLLLLAVGVIVARPEAEPTAIVFGADAGGFVAKRLIAPVLVLPVILGALTLAGSRLGYYDAEFATGVLAISVALTTGGMVLTATHALRVVDRRRRAAEEARDRLSTQLAQAERLESLGQLAGGVAHDFNNMLSVILNYSEFVQSTLHELAETAPERERLDEAAHDVGQIRAAAEGAARLTHQLLAFARRETTQPVPTDLNAVIREVNEFLARTVGEHVRLETSLHDGLRRIEADRGQLDQVLINLAVNARDAMPEGGTFTVSTDNFDVGEIYTERHPEIAPGRYVRVQASDTGVGMPAEVMRRAFDPFFTTKGVGKGTGLGLATIYGIVKQAQGSIHLYSEPGLGTTITILLPALPETAPAPAAARPPRSKDSTIEGCTVLLVEDEPALREVTRRILVAAGCRVLVAEEAPDAVAIATAHERPIDLLLTDMVMPDLSGQQVAAQMRELQPDIRVLYMSGYAEALVTANGRLEEDARFISKPFAGPGLVEAITRAMTASD